MDATQKEMKFFEDYRFTGTAEYHRITMAPKFLATDGALHVAETFGTFWFFDDVSIVLAFNKEVPKIREYVSKDDGWFFTIYLVKTDGGGCDVIYEDGNDNELYRQHYEYTDCPENLKIFIAKQDDYWVAMLPSEY